MLIDFWTYVYWTSSIQINPRNMSLSYELPIVRHAVYGSQKFLWPVYYWKRVYLMTPVAASCAMCKS